MKYSTSINIVAIIIILSLVSSCGWSSFRRNLGVSTEAPDEFLVEDKNSLVIPREFSLPKPGQKGQKDESRLRKQAKNLLFGDNEIQSSSKTTNNGIEKSFQQNIGTSNVANIRNTIESEFKNERSVFGTKKGSTLETLVDPFGVNRAKPKLVDGAKENQRIRKSIANQEKVSGDENVVVIEGWN